jgi:hypothetical protein
MSTTGGGPPAGVATLIFDVLGTVVDEAGSVAAERPGRWPRREPGRRRRTTSRRNGFAGLKR